MKSARAFAAVAIAMLVASAPLPSRADLASSFGVYVYPTQGQDSNQQAAAESQCYSSAQQKTGFDPSAPPPTPAPTESHRGGILRGGAGGAAAGAAIGAIAGNAGEGAAIGAVTGGLFGVRRQNQQKAQAAQSAQYNANAQYQGGMNNFRTAFSACMSAQGYVAR